MICACSVSVPSVLVRQELAPSTHITDESLTEHAHITYKTRTIHVCSTYNHLPIILVRCCAWNVRSLSVIVSDTCAVYTRFIGDSDHAQPQKRTNFSTNNHAQTNFMRDLCVIYASLAMGLGL